MTPAIDARAKELRKHPAFDQMVLNLLHESISAEDWKTHDDCASWLDEGDQLAADRCARALATDEALAKACACPIGGENPDCPVHGGANDEPDMSTGYGDDLGKL